MRAVILSLVLAVLPFGAHAGNVFQFAEGTGQLSRFAAAMQQTGIDRALANPGPYTIFAPTNSAFSAMPNVAMGAQGREKLVEILTCHMAPTQVVSSVLATGRPAVIRTVGGCRLTLYKNGSQLMVRDSAGRDHRIKAADLRQSNGVVHVIDTLILPST
ncbi:fasciclin domain-containing protein [Falsirhodobacter halotolerans]|uniref:fasciclin domain-containing protein n=1 Tax=Falsirhodobacter halotolerans TaxID=1146892 RepID=UPI001FD2A26B|nr:fasciclin domain-containing protein [Falsirhodobacter halotolerans]MCJ8139601.1 fasciclin domain-containing protein [Falsirhodobacter halotolerans]